MRELTPSTPMVRKLKGVAAITKGGTGASDTGGAAINLDVVNADLLGLPGKPAKVQPNQGVDQNNYPSAFPLGPTLEGTTDLYVNTTYTFKISNYDRASDAVYTVSVDVGIVSRVRDVITLITPGVPGIVNLTVAKRKVRFVVKPPGVQTPSITSPLPGSVNLPSTVYLNSSGFKVTAGMSNHLSSDWEISSAADFSVMIKSSYNDTINKTSFSVDGLREGGIYYARVRYRDSVLGNSNWSEGSSFSTKLSYNFSTEEAKLVSNKGESPEYFGWSVCFTPDSSRVVVSSLRDNLATGAIYVFRREGTSWIMEQKLIGSGSKSQDFSSYCPVISKDGVRVAFGAVLADEPGFSDSGAVYIFVRTGTTWVQEARLISNPLRQLSRLGWSLGFSDNHARLIVGAGEATNTYNSDGSVYFFTRKGNVWTQEAMVVAGDPGEGAKFGTVSDINGPGDVAIIGAPFLTVNGKTNAGAVYIFVISNGTWTQSYKITPGDLAAGDQFGTSVRFSKDGNTILVGAPAANSGRGAAYLYKLANGIWTLSFKFTADDGVLSDAFGTVVAINGAANTVVVGAPMASPFGYSVAGSAYVFKLVDGFWSQVPRINASDATAGDWFGWSVAISEDGGRIIVGARNKKQGTVDLAGAAYIFN